MTSLLRLEGKKALITGGIGFIGSNLARRLVELGADVTVVDSLIPQYGGNRFNLSGLEDKLTINISDVRDVHSMRHLIAGNDFLFNLAGQTSHLDSMQDPFADLDINCRAQLSILETCRNYNQAIKIVFASTRQIYGKPDYLPVDELHILRPTDVNGINKMAGEWYHTLYNNVYGIRTTSLRLTNTYGPRMRVKDARQTFLGIWIKLVVEGKPFEVWGGDQLRDFTYVDDAADAMILAATNEIANGKVYNLGGCEVVTLRQLAETLVRINGGGEFVTGELPENRKRIDIGDYHANHERITSELGWVPTVNLEAGLSRSLEYYRANLRNYL